jgi:cytochrome c553
VDPGDGVDSCRHIRREPRPSGRYVIAGRQKALMCQTCHGLDGKAKIPEAPNLGGQSKMYLVKALRDYRSGARKNEMMSLVASTLKDDDIDDLAAFYSALEGIAAPPPK